MTSYTNTLLPEEHSESSVHRPEARTENSPVWKCSWLGPFRHPEEVVRPWARCVVRETRAETTSWLGILRVWRISGIRWNSVTKYSVPNDLLVHKSTLLYLANSGYMDNLNLVKIHNGGLVSGLSQFQILPRVPQKMKVVFKSDYKIFLIFVH